MVLSMFLTLKNWMVFVYAGNKIALSLKRCPKYYRFKAIVFDLNPNACTKSRSSFSSTYITKPYIDAKILIKYKSNLKHLMNFLKKDFITENVLIIYQLIIISNNIFAYINIVCLFTINKTDNVYNLIKVLAKCK